MVDQNRYRAALVRILMNWCGFKQTKKMLIPLCRKTTVEGLLLETAISIWWRLFLLFKMYLVIFVSKFFIF